MPVTATAYFLGKYRPLYVTAETPALALHELGRRIERGPEALRERFESVVRETLIRTEDRACYGCSSEHGTYGVSWTRGDQWPALVALVADLPPCPHINY